MTAFSQCCPYVLKPKAGRQRRHRGYESKITDSHHYLCCSLPAVKQINTVYSAGLCSEDPAPHSLITACTFITHTHTHTHLLYTPPHSLCVGRRCVLPTHLTSEQTLARILECFSCLCFKNHSTVVCEFSGFSRDRTVLLRVCC